MRYYDINGEKLASAALGCDHFDEAIPRETALKNLDLYREAGGNVLDTAHAYCQEGNHGISKSEALIGQWMKERGCRKNVFLVTKGCHPVKGDYHASRVDREGITEDVETSLESLGPVDLWYLHRDRPDMPADEIIDMVNEIVVKPGYSRFIGASNWTAARIEEANSWAKSHGRVPFSFSELQYSLAHCDPLQWGDDTIVCMNSTEKAWYEKTKMPVMSFSSQAKGYFSKVIEGGEATGKSKARFDTEENRKMIPKVKELMKKYGVSAAAIATAFLTSQSWPVIAIVGASKTSQLEDTLRGIDLRLTGEDIALLGRD